MQTSRIEGLHYFYDLICEVSAKVEVEAQLEIIGDGTVRAESILYVKE